VDFVRMRWSTELSLTRAAGSGCWWGAVHKKRFGNAVWILPVDRSFSSLSHAMLEMKNKPRENEQSIKRRNINFMLTLQICQDFDKGKKVSR